MKKLLLLLLLMILVLSLGFMGGALAKGGGGEYKASVDTDGVQRVTIKGGSYYFEPERVVVKVNVPVEFTVSKESGLTPHNFVLKAPDAGLDVTLSLGKEPKKALFTPTKTGEFTFYCNKKLPFVKSHREKGMSGILKVVE